MSIRDDLDMLKATVNALSVRMVALQSGVDNATAAHALADVLGRWVGEVTTETYVLALDAGAEVALELASGDRACLACLGIELDGYLHRR